MTKDRKCRKNTPVWYYVIKYYVKTVVDGIYYRKVVLQGMENVPPAGTPVVLVSNHQNCLNDPLEYALLFRDRIPNFLARANVFQIHPVVDRFLRYLRMLPVYRASFDGTSSLSQNSQTFDAASDALVCGQTVILYPECGHQDKRWLGNFSVGYLKLAFLAAEKMGFGRDVLIQPSCNHYSGYFHTREDMLVGFGEPVSLMPYYELYRKAPREAMRKVNAIVRARVESIMLNIKDLDHYDEIDFIRNSTYGQRFATENGLSAFDISDRLSSDKRLVVELENKYDTDDVYSAVREYRSFLEDNGLRDWLFERKPGYFHALSSFILLVCLFPLFVVAMIPNLLVYLVPEIFKRKLIKDRMFNGSFNIGVSVFVTIPLCYILPAIVIAFIYGFWSGVLYLVLCPAAFMFTWFYIVRAVKFSGILRFAVNNGSETYRKMASLRERIHERLDSVLGRKRDVQ